MIAPAERGRDLRDDRLEQVRVVVDAELVRHGHQHGVRVAHRRVVAQLRDDLLRLADVGLAEAGDAAVEVADLVFALAGADAPK